MRIRIMTPAVLGLLFGLTRLASADLAPPFPPPKGGNPNPFAPVKAQPAAFKIEVDDKAKGPKLIIPLGGINQPNIRPVPRRGAVPGDPKGELPVEDGDGVAYEQPEQPRNHTLIAGVALALSMTFGGLWFMRRKGVSSNRTLAMWLVAGSSLAIGTLVWADIPGPRPRPPVKIPPAVKLPPLPTLLDTKVQVEYSFGNEPIRLIIDSETLEKLKKDPKPPEGVKPPETPKLPRRSEIEISPI